MGLFSSSAEETILPFRILFVKYFASSFVAFLYLHWSFAGFLVIDVPNPARVGVCADVYALAVVIWWRILFSFAVLIGIGNV